jgi:hypothetical protein
VGRRLGTIADVRAEFPFLTERWLRRVRSERRMTTWVVAGRVLFDLDLIGQFIEEGRDDPPDDAA